MPLGQPWTRIDLLLDLKLGAEANIFRGCAHQDPELAGLDHAVELLVVKGEVIRDETPLNRRIQTRPGEFA
jgi:hypothetical protein